MIVPYDNLEVQYNLSRLILRFEGKINRFNCLLILSHVVYVHIWSISFWGL